MRERGAKNEKGHWCLFLFLSLSLFEALSRVIMDKDEVAAPLLLVTRDTSASAVHSDVHSNPRSMRTAGDIHLWLRQTRMHTARNLGCRVAPPRTRTMEFCLPSALHSKTTCMKFSVLQFMHSYFKTKIPISIITFICKNWNFNFVDELKLKSKDNWVLEFLLLRV